MEDNNSGVRKPLYALLVSPDQNMRDNIVSGKKKITIREGYRDYKSGPVMLCCHLDPWVVMADITSVKYCNVSEVTTEELKADGFTSKRNLLEGLRNFYPSLNWDSPVTVIRWDNVRGALIDAEDEE